MEYPKPPNALTADAGSIRIAHAARAIVKILQRFHERRAIAACAAPFEIGRDGTRAEVIAKHRAWLCDQPQLMADLPELRGRDLVCWCAPAACHGDTLRELANE